MEHARLAMVVEFRELDLYRVRLPLLKPWRAAGVELPFVETLLARFATESGPVWSESTPFSLPVFTAEWAAAAFQLTRDTLAPRLLHRKFSSPNELAQALSFIRGNAYAKALFDFAYWAMCARNESRPLSTILGATRKHSEVSDSLGTYANFDELVAAVGDSAQRGFQSVKLKFSRGENIAELRELVQGFPHLRISIDANGTFTASDTPLLKELDQIGLAMIEQPLSPEDDLGHARLASSMTTPIALDESAGSVARVAQLIELKACRIIHIKPARVGGLTPARAIHDLCVAHGISCTIGSQLESAIGSDFTVALAALEGFNTPGTIFPSARLYKLDLAEHPFELARINGHMTAPVSERLLRVPDAERLKSWSVEHARIV